MTSSNPVGDRSELSQVTGALVDASAMRTVAELISRLAELIPFSEVPVVLTALIALYGGDVHESIGKKSRDQLYVEAAKAIPQDELRVRGLGHSARAAFMLREIKSKAFLRWCVTGQHGLPDDPQRLIRYRAYLSLKSAGKTLLSAKQISRILEREMSVECP